MTKIQLLHQLKDEEWLSETQGPAETTYGTDVVVKQVPEISMPWAFSSSGPVEIRENREEALVG